MFVSYELTLPVQKFTILPANTSDQTTHLLYNSANRFAEFLASFPLYKSQSEIAVSWKTYVVIMLSRIIIGYGIYQTIAAFRKFAGK
jgi:hypothetical protein